MSHKFKVVEEAHLNKDGSLSETKKDRFVVHTGRGGRWKLGPYTKKQCEESIEAQRSTFFRRHMAMNPNDMAFRLKHGLVE